MTKECQQLELKLQRPRASLVAQMVKNLPAMQETWIQSPDQEDPLENGMATHSIILAWRILSITLLVCEMSAIAW